MSALVRCFPQNDTYSSRYNNGRDRFSRYVHAAVGAVGTAGAVKTYIINEG